MSGMGHFVWFILTLLTGFIALPFWIIAALICGSSRRKIDDRKRDEQIALLKDIASQTRRNK